MLREIVPWMEATTRCGRRRRHWDFVYCFAMTAEVMLAAEPAAASDTLEPLRFLLEVRFDVCLEVMLACRA
jgi:hypothetical protein